MTFDERYGHRVPTIEDHLGTRADDIHDGSDWIKLAHCGRAFAHVSTAAGEDGRWRAGFNFTDRGFGIASGVRRRDEVTFASRQEAIDDIVEMAKAWFYERSLSDEDAAAKQAAAGRNRQDAARILEQLEERTTPKQLEMFA
jgi:hypothetical protein